MKSQKSKGIKGERELIHLFHQLGWSAVRVAGSGSSKYPSPDILAANAIRRIAVECKVTKDAKKYFYEEDLEQLKTFSRTFGAEGWIGIKFKELPWHFIMPEDLEKTGNCWAASQELVQRRGLLAEDLLNISEENRKL